ncbi:hypothetical protein Poly30_38120 [Planctomycetes bacterium Poly30]|uniref:DUF1565 domain-containing protein n=1 Tax=Saltatorellus ferox TaxID=2528018 RepID=A0A518EW04_9BACT|nr:hypothetical protein Poly30_38120 [Planctomycetes bacterium Poly30]
MHLNPLSVGRLAVFFLGLPGLSLSSAAPRAALPLTPWADVWVNPVSGSDASVGTSASTALKTLLEAVSRVSAGDTVHLLPGTYAEATGEMFPIVIPAGVRLESTAGRNVTTIDGRGASSPATYIFDCRPGSTLAGVTLLRDSQDHLGFTIGDASTTQLIEDVEFVGGAAVLQTENSYFQFDRCAMRSQTTASVSVRTQSDLDELHLRLNDCELSGSPDGVKAQFTALNDASIELERCRMVDGGIAINLYSASYTTPKLALRNCLIARNGTGIQIGDGGLLLYTQVNIEHCTITDHVRYGIDIRETNFPESGIHSSIITGSGYSDVRVQAYGVPIRMRHSLVEDGGYQAHSSNLSGDPGFMAASIGNYSLRADSVCLDKGLSGVPSSSTDLDGRPRSMDGDLDLGPAPDMGALEHAPLAGPDAIEIGQQALFGLSGPPGSFSTLIIAPGGYASFGNTTPFGRLFLQPTGAFRVTPVMTTGGAPTWVDVSSIIDPSWVGTSIGFQALPRSFAAPAGGAYSNPLLIPVE